MASCVVMFMHGILYSFAPVIHPQSSAAPALLEVKLKFKVSREDSLRIVLVAAAVSRCCCSCRRFDPCGGVFCGRFFVKVLQSRACPRPSLSMTAVTYCPNQPLKRCSYASRKSVLRICAPMEVLQWWCSRGGASMERRCSCGGAPVEVLPRRCSRGGGDCCCWILLLT